MTISTTVSKKQGRQAKDVLKSFLRIFPPIKQILASREARGFVPPGHFYSPIVSVAELTTDEKRIFGIVPRTIGGIEMNESYQLSLIDEFETYYKSIPFAATKTAGARYYFENPAYSYSDAIILHCMIRHANPKKIIEVGSGFSSCAILDTNEKFFDNSIETTFIEPYPALFESLISADDKSRVTIIPKRLQDVSLEVFRQLQANDILFIDSTHVSKTGSDVNQLFFEVLPALRSGVYVHIHDIFYPFEYPKEWIFGGRSWNEMYLLRAFLQYNTEFQIIFMNTFLEHFHLELFKEKMPLCLKDLGGSIWIRKN